MTFAFVSHAQPDKMRPDQRMRTLVHLLHQAGVPLWIDRPDELGLSADALKERCVSLNGRWPADIGDALNTCSAGLGFWSLHARTRVQQEGTGVLAQELQTLSIASKLHLVCIDPGVVNDTGVAFRNLTQGQQVIDVGAVDRHAFSQRMVRLIESLAAATGARPGRWRPYARAIVEQGRTNAFGGFLQPELKRAREAASVLAASFAGHDPGRLAITLTPELAESYERLAAECRRVNRRFRTYHRMLALMGQPSGHLRACLNDVEPGLAGQVEAWLQTHAAKGSEPYLAISVLADPHFEAARALAEMELAPAIDERHALLALLAEPGSGTMRALRRSIGEDQYAVLEQRARQRRASRPDWVLSGSLGDLDA